MTLQHYVREPSASGWHYRLSGTLRGFSVVPFEGLWRATNGSRSVLAVSPDLAALSFVEAL